MEIADGKCMWRLKMRRITAAILTIIAFAVATPRAEALTTRDIIELSRAGLGEEVLLALIDVNGGIYAIDPVTLKALKDARVSERVILALVRSGRERPDVPQPLPAVEPPVVQAPPPQVVVIEHHAPDVREVLVPVYVAVPSGRHHRVHRADHHVRPATESTFIPFQSGMPAVRPPVQHPKEPVYWGFGGKLRPDAWGQPQKTKTGQPTEKGKQQND